MTQSFIENSLVEISETVSNIGEIIEAEVVTPNTRSAYVIISADLGARKCTFGSTVYLEDGDICIKTAATVCNPTDNFRHDLSREAVIGRLILTEKPSVRMTVSKNREEMESNALNLVQMIGATISMKADKITQAVDKHAFRTSYLLDALAENDQALSEQLNKIIKP